MIRRTKGVRLLAVIAALLLVGISLSVLRAFNGDPYKAEFARANATLEAAVDAVVECARDDGVSVDTQLAPNGISYQFGLSFPGFRTKAEADEARAGAVRVLEGCQAVHGVTAASQAVTAIVAPSREQLRPVAIECAQANGQTVPKDASADEAIAAAAASPEGTACFVGQANELTRRRRAELEGG